jgi:MFS family permease
LIGAGCLGIYLSTFPSYSQLLVLFALLAVCSGCLFWPALLKAIRNLAGKDEQGRMFGFLEGGRGVVDTVVAFSALGVFALLGSGPGGFRAAILVYATIDIVVGVLVFVLLGGIKERVPVDATPKRGPGLAAIKEAVKLPQLWWVSFTVFRCTSSTAV